MAVVNILPLDSDKAQLKIVGGKGANLSKLARAGFPVPGGFLITTSAYREFVQANQLNDIIQAQTEEIESTDPGALTKASEVIRAAFKGTKIPTRLAAEISSAYQALPGNPLAVRSSATAEDLPDMSFAGQQDTFLHVIGEAALLEKTVAADPENWRKKQYPNGIIVYFRR